MTRWIVLLLALSSSPGFAAKKQSYDPVKTLYLCYDLFAFGMAASSCASPNDIVQGAYGECGSLEVDLMKHTQRTQGVEDALVVVDQLRKWARPKLFATILSAQRQRRCN